MKRSHSGTLLAQGFAKFGVNPLVRQFNWHTGTPYAPLVSRMGQLDYCRTPAKVTVEAAKLASTDKGSALLPSGP